MKEMTREASLSTFYGCGAVTVLWFLSRKRTKEANLTFAQARVQRPGIQMPHLHASTVQVAMVSPSPSKGTSARVMKPECTQIQITYCAALGLPWLFRCLGFFFFFEKDLVAGDSGRCWNSQRKLSLLSRCYDSQPNFSRYAYNGKMPAVCSTTVTYSRILLLWLCVPGARWQYKLDCIFVYPAGLKALFCIPATLLVCQLSLEHIHNQFQLFVMQLVFFFFLVFPPSNWQTDSAVFQFHMLSEFRVNSCNVVSAVVLSPPPPKKVKKIK